MTEPGPLERTHSADEVAEALDFSVEYVKRKARAGEWPHCRGPRNSPRFTDAQYRQILELIAVPVQSSPEPRLSWAPRSGRRSA